VCQLHNNQQLLWTLNVKHNHFLLNFQLNENLFKALTSFILKVIEIESKSPQMLFSRELLATKMHSKQIKRTSYQKKDKKKRESFVSFLSFQQKLSLFLLFL
jgi:hypothetical protein